MGCSKGIKKEIALKQYLKNVTLNLNPIYFDLIKARVKVLEGRLNDEKGNVLILAILLHFLENLKNKKL